MYPLRTTHLRTLDTDCHMIEAEKLGVRVVKQNGCRNENVRPYAHERVSPPNYDTLAPNGRGKKKKEKTLPSPFVIKTCCLVAFTFLPPSLLLFHIG